MDIIGRTIGHLDENEINALKDFEALPTMCDGVLLCEDCVFRTDYGCFAYICSKILERDKVLK